MMKKILLACFSFITISFISKAQKITYSEPERDDVRSVDFDIVGKLNNHYLVYKHIRSTYNICIYDDDMKQLDKVKMDFLQTGLLILKLFLTEIISILFINIKKEIS